MRLLAFFLLAAALASPPDVPDVWPLPASFSLGNQVARIAPGISFTYNFGDPEQLEILKLAGESFINNTFPVMDGATPYISSIWHDKIYPNYTVPDVAPTLTDINIFVSTREELALNVDESYKLTVGIVPGAITLNATTIWGALHGLETLSQLVTWNWLTGIPGPESPEFCIFRVGMTIEDSPRWAWRGLMVDVSRNYLPASFLKHVIDAMAMNKLNTLHLHISDAESFPFVSQTFPEMIKGAYAPEAKYTGQQLGDLVAYAMQKGVRVVPELDSPGHTASWEKGFPGINANCWESLRGKYGYLRWPAWDSIPLDMTNPLAKNVTEGLIRELSSIFSDQYFHVGGDEVISSCLKADAKIVQWMIDNGYTTDEAGWQALQKVWEEWVTGVVSNLHKTSVVWQEVFTSNASLPPDTVVQAWKDPYIIQNITAAGYRSVNSFGWYLDRQAPTCVAAPCATNWLWEWTWMDFYKVEPLAGWTPTQAQHDLLIGGELCMWGEAVSPSNFDSRVWSRAPGATERFWSPKFVNSTTQAQERFASFSCKMRRRGVANGPSQPGFCSGPVAVPDIPINPISESNSKLAQFEIATIALGLIAGFSLLGLAYAVLKVHKGTSLLTERTANL